MGLTPEQKTIIREHYLNRYLGQDAPAWEREERHCLLLCFKYDKGKRVIEAVLLGRDGNAHAQMIYSQQDEDTLGLAYFVQEAVASCWRYAAGHAVIVDTEEEHGVRFLFLETPNGLIVEAGAIPPAPLGIPVQKVQAGIPGTFEELSDSTREEVKAGLRLALAARIETNREAWRKRQRVQRQP